MSTRYQDKYRISSARLHKWDYTWNAIYFVTINTQGQEELFGEIRNGEMMLSNLGTIANVLWYEIKNHYSVVDLDAFVVMPNHVHGILAIKNPANYSKNKTETGQGNAQFQVAGEKRFQNPGKNSLSTIIGSYKSAVSKHAHRLGYDFDWQTRFHDRIVRDREGLIAVRKYIDDNVANWNKDEINTRLS